MSKVIFVFQNLPEYDINNLYIQYSFVFTFTNIFLTIRQDWYCLFKHCLSTQRRPHARPRAMPRAVFSFTNNTVDKEYNQSYFENNQSYWKTIQSYQSYNPTMIEVPKKLLPAPNKFYPNRLIRLSQTISLVIPTKIPK